MNLTIKQNKLYQQLKLNLDLINKSVDALIYSQKKCEALLNNDEYSDLELESCEALTARFARVAMY